eukprot:5163018-Pyramimonas_sp.AAC.1
MSYPKATPDCHFRIAACALRSTHPRALTPSRPLEPVEAFSRLIHRSVAWTQAGGYVEDEQCNQFIALVTHTPDLQVRYGSVTPPSYTFVTPESHPCYRLAPARGPRPDS